MRSKLLLSATLLVASMASAKAQVPLSSYVDANGFIDDQKMFTAWIEATRLAYEDAANIVIDSPSYFTSKDRVGLANAIRQRIRKSTMSKSKKPRRFLRLQ